MAKPWIDAKTNPDGEPVRVRSRRSGAVVYRQRSGSEAAQNLKWAQSWSFKRMVNGVRAVFPLGRDLDAACRLADEIATFLDLPMHTLDMAMERYNLRAIERGTRYSTVAELFAVHRKNWQLLELDPATAARYQSCLVTILRLTEAWRDGVEPVQTSGRRDVQTLLWPRWTSKTLDVLTSTLLNDYKRLMLAGVDADDADEEELLTAKITCDSTIRQARAIFSKQAMRLYKEQRGLLLPDIAEFMDVRTFGAKKYFELLPDRVIRQVFENLPLLKSADLNAYRVFLAAVQCGLRRSEIAALSMDWFEDETPPILKLREAGEFRPKHGHGRTVVLRPWVWAEVQAVRASDGFFLAGDATERTEAVFKRLITWLQSNQVTATKPIHELRKLWFSSKVKLEGLLAAQQQGGHRDPKVTSQFYASNQMKAELLPFWTGEVAS